MNVVDLLRQSRVKIPWKKYYTKEELKFNVEDISIYEMFKRSALSNLNCPAVNYYGRVYSYKEFLKGLIERLYLFHVLG